MVLKQRSEHLKDSGIWARLLLQEAEGFKVIRIKSNSTAIQQYFERPSIASLLDYFEFVKSGGGELATGDRDARLDFEYCKNLCERAQKKHLNMREFEILVLQSWFKISEIWEEKGSKLFPNKKYGHSADNYLVFDIDEITNEPKIGVCDV